MGFAALSPPYIWSLYERLVLDNVPPASGGGGLRQRVRPELAGLMTSSAWRRGMRAAACRSEIRYRTKNRSSSNRHSALLVILIKARSIGFAGGLCSGSAMTA